MDFAPDPFVAFDTFVSRRLHPGETVDEYLGDLQDLARLIEENTSDRWLSYAFESGLLDQVRRQLCGSSRMEYMTQEHILARTRTLMTEKVEVDEPVAPAAGWRRVLPRVPVGPPSTPNEQSRFSATSVEVPNILPETAGSLRANYKERSRKYTVISASNKVSGKWGKGRDGTATLSPHKLEVLPVMKVTINSVGGFRLLLIRCERNVMSTRSTEKYHNADNRQEVPSKPWCWQHIFNSD